MYEKKDISYQFPKSIAQEILSVLKQVYLQSIKTVL